MHGRHRRRIDLLQNLLITLLTVSAVVLFAQSQLYAVEDSFLRQWLDPAAASGSSTVTSGPNAAPMTFPVRVAVSGDTVYGRYGNVTLTTADEAFAPLSTLLTESMGSAHSLAACGEEDFFSALARTSVYYDFLTPLPLSVLAALAEVPAPDETVSARYLVISSDPEENARLLIWDGKEDYRSFETAVSAADLEAVINLYELGSAHFAFDNAELNRHYAEVAPCSLFLSSPPELAELAAVNPLTSTQHILSLLGFNPYTNSRYTESNGTEVIVDSDHSLRILPNGRIRYQAGSDELLTVKAAGAVPTQQEAVSGASALLSQLLSGASGDAALYLLDIRHSGDDTVLHFGYQYNGIPIRLPDSESAATVYLSGASVISLSLYFRQYTAGSETSLLLPLPQAIAIAAAQPGRELFLGYSDSGAARTAAGWLLD